jgi:HEAT repeat protein
MDAPDDLIATLIRLRRDPKAGPDEIIPVITALRDKRLRDAAPGQPPREIRLGERRLGEAVPVLRDFLRDADMEVVARAGQTLAWLDAREAVPDLIDLLRPEAVAERRIAIPLVFENWGLSYPDEGAMYALQLLKATDAIPNVAACLASESERTRQSARETLQALDAAPYVARLLAADDARLRAEAADFFRSAPIKAALRPAVEASLLSILEKDGADARRVAVEALGRVASIDAVMSLLSSLDRPDTDEDMEHVVRAAIAEIQSRRPGAAPGQDLLADPASGQLSLSDGGGGEVSLVDDPAREDPGD